MTDTDRIDSLTCLKQSVLNFIASDARFSSIRLRAEYPGQKEFPLREITLVAGIDRVESSPVALGGYYGGDTNGVGAVITLRLDLYIPRQVSANEGHSLYEALCEILLLDGGVLGAGKLWCEAAEFEAASGALRFPVKAELQAMLGREHKTILISDFYLKRSEYSGDNK